MPNTQCWCCTVQTDGRGREGQENKKPQLSVWKTWPDSQGLIVFSFVFPISCLRRLTSCRVIYNLWTQYFINLCCHPSESVYQPLTLLLVSGLWMCFELLGGVRTLEVNRFQIQLFQPCVFLFCSDCFISAFRAAFIKSPVRSVWVCPWPD